MTQAATKVDPMSSAFQPDHIRLSDAERADAMSALGHALGEGRLTLAEYDERCRDVAAAQLRSELEPLFADIPQRPGEHRAGEHEAGAPAGVPAPQAPSEMAVYTAREVVETRRQGQKKRFGTFLLGSIGSLAGVIVFGSAQLEVLAGLTFLLIPTLFVLLYVMKVGPDDWYTPTVRQLEKHRRQAMRAQQLELETQRKMERQEQLSQLTGDAIGLAQNTVNRFKPRG